MQTFNLGYDEYVLLETEDAFWVNRDGLSINNFVLTNKRILCDYEMSNGLFKKSAQEFCEYYLTDILATNGEALVCQTKFESYWCIQIHFRQGTEYFSFSESPKKIIPQWVNGIIDAIAKLDNKQQKEEKQSEGHTEGTFFCSDCGTRLEIGAKFCKNCGKSVIQEEPVNKPDESKPEESTERETVYEGKIHKCPNCGETVDSFEAVCKSCGYEIRGAKATSSVKELEAKLETIEATRERQKSKSFIERRFGRSLTKTDEQEISLIRNFSIPNTKEDLYEFLILSESNIDADAYDEIGNQYNSRIALSDAWKAKFEQAYRKAKIVFSDSPEMQEIENLYSLVHKSIKKGKYKTWKLLGIFSVITFSLLIFLLIITSVTSSIDEKEEIKRLCNIESQIQTALEDKDYRLALMNADRLRYNEIDDDLKCDWEIKREYWIDKIIEDAGKNGVVLEAPEETKEKTEETDSEETKPQGFFEGFKEGFQSQLDDAMKKDDNT